MNNIGKKFYNTGANVGNTVVEQSPNHPMVKVSNLGVATVTQTENIARKKLYNARLVALAHL